MRNFPRSWSCAQNLNPRLRFPLRYNRPRKQTTERARAALVCESQPCQKACPLSAAVTPASGHSRLEIPARCHHQPTFQANPALPVKVCSIALASTLLPAPAASNASFGPSAAIISQRWMYQPVSAAGTALFSGPRHYTLLQ